MSVRPAAIASSIIGAGNVFDTATTVTSLRARPACAHAAAMRFSTRAAFSRIDTAPLHQPPLRPIDGEIGEAIGVLVAGAQRVANLEVREPARQPTRLAVQRDQIRMLDAILPEHLIHQQQRVGDDLDVIGTFRGRGLQRVEQAGVFGDVVRGRAEVARTPR